jgi:hypothetical protein
MTCHQGRNSKLTYDGYLATSYATANPQRLAFQNVHYFIAGATQYSTKAAVYYPWTAIADTATTPFPTTRTYQGVWTHAAESAWVPYKQDTSTPTNPALDTGGMPTNAQCVFCHLQETNRHTFKPEAGEDCTVCHPGTDVTAYRKGNGVNGGSPMTTDFDGNPATTKLPEEVEAFQAALLKAMNDYASRAGKRYFVYDAHENPYWFASVDNDGTKDDIHGSSSSSPNNTVPDGKIDSNDRYDQFDKFLLFGAHNYQCVSKDPGAWAHNGRYVLQVLYDSIDYLDDGLWNDSPKNVTTNASLVRPIRNF